MVLGGFRNCDREVQLFQSAERLGPTRGVSGYKNGRHDQCGQNHHNQNGEPNLDSTAQVSRVLH